MIKVRIERNFVGFDFEYDNTKEVLQLIWAILSGHKESFPLTFTVFKYEEQNDGGEED